MVAYYSEWDPYAAEWLRNLIARGLIPAGDVDERSIVDVSPDDLKGYTQCHFFAGIGGWAYACRLAGWPDDEPIWTGSPPCQPFSVAGKRKGQEDERHLWPELFRLVRACRPPVLFGEQVAAAVGQHWLDGVLADLEGEGYAGRAFVIPACAVDAPHRRDRLWFVAEDVGHADGGRGRPGQPAAEALGHGRPAVSGGSAGDVADADGQGSFPAAQPGVHRGEKGAGPRDGEPQRYGVAGDVADAGSAERRSATEGRLNVAYRPDAGRQEAASRSSVHGSDDVADTARELSHGGRDEWPRRRGEHPDGRGSGDVADADQLGASEGWEQRGGQFGRPGGDPEPRPSDVGHPGASGSPLPEREAAVGARRREEGRAVAQPSRASSPWADARWLLGADGKARRVEPGIRLLAHGVSGRMAIRRTVEQAGAEAQEEHWYNRVGALRGFGNAIVPEVAAQILAAYRESRIFE